MSSSSTSPQKHWHTWALLGFVIALSYLTYFHRYWQPAAPFWDENYYITDAQREMNDVFYMQIHPPLGKLLIAWGEELTQTNERQDQFLSTEHAGTFPQGFSFVGYRLFPVMLSWLAAPLLFAIFLLITKNALHSTLLSFLYIFDNALIVHNRGAMLDGPMMFFLVLTLLGFFLVLRYRNAKPLWKFLMASVVFGAGFGLGMATKSQNMIMAILVPFILWQLWPSWKKILHFAWASFLTFAILYTGVWMIHFSHMVTINPQLNNNGYYQASPAYKEILAKGKQGSLLSFPVMLRDSFTFMGEYNKGIPKLDLCKPDENGSPYFLWPIGATSINYRWETPGDGSYRYLYLQSNPAVWFGVLGAVILTVVYLLGPLFYPQKKDRFTEGRRGQILALAALYFGYMAAMAMMDRVFFLYSYFPPLLFGFVLCALLLMEFRRVGRFVFDAYGRTIALLLLAVPVFVCFQFFRPLTYYQPLTDTQIENRALLPLWQLRCVNCGNQSPLVKHRCDA